MNKQKETQRLGRRGSTGGARGRRDSAQQLEPGAADVRLNHWRASPNGLQFSVETLTDGQLNQAQLCFARNTTAVAGVQMIWEPAALVKALDALFLQVSMWCPPGASQPSVATIE